MPDADPWPAVACLGVLSSRHGCNGDAALRAAGRPRLLPAGDAHVKPALPWNLPSLRNFTFPLSLPGEPTLPWNLLFSLRRPSPKPRSCAARMGLAPASSRRRRGGRPASTRSKGGRQRAAQIHLELKDARCRSMASGGQPRCALLPSWLQRRCHSSCCWASAASTCR